MTAQGLSTVWSFARYCSDVLHRQCLQVISLLLVEHPLLHRRALVARLTLELDLVVLAEAGYQSEAVRRADALHPDVVLVDAEVPNLDLTTIVRRLRARSPSSGIVLLSLDSSALAGTFNGDVPIIVGKHEGIEALLVAIRAAAVHQTDGSGR